jgi:uncharacterized repeat protein (TIGR01451 family)
MVVRAGIVSIPSPRANPRITVEGRLLIGGGLDIPRCISRRAGLASSPGIRAGQTRFPRPCARVGPAPAGASRRITYSVTVDNPDTGGHVLTGTITSPTVGSNCPVGNTRTRCTATVDVSQLTIVNTASAPTSAPGGVVSYTITAANSGQAAFAGATLTVGLAPVLDDATYNGDAAATVGIVSYASPTLTWTGSLDPGDTATITFSATVSNPDTGDEILSTTATSAAAGNNCPSGSTDPNCSTTISVSVVTITNTASTSTATPGSTVSYTVTVSNTGRVDLTDLVFALPLSDVLDDAAYGNNATATEGLVLFAGSERLGGPDDVRVHAEGYRGDPAHHPARAEAVQSLGRPQPVL